MNPLRWAITLFLLVGLSTNPAFAQRELKEIPPVDPEVERATFVVPEGFEVNLYAADPQIAKPIQMNFDPAGRLWIASSEIYPQIQPGQKANDKVLVISDTDGDGTADETNVFADGLLIPTGVLPGDGGVYVANSTELLFLRDSNNDAKADQRTVVLSGFGTEDTHHIIHTFRWGPEQLMYFSQSIYIHSHIETPWGVKRLNAGGIWQFRPENLKLDIILRGLVNTWGTTWNQWGATFATDGAGTEGINYVVPGGYYTTAANASRILHGLNPGSPKHCGLEFVSGRALPEDWQGSLIANDFRGHRVCRFVLKEQGSGFISQEQQEVIRSTHPAFRPVDVKMGPDGAIYIADWYNPIIQHGEVDFRDPRRDHTHGRIWRVSHKSLPKVPQPKLVEASIPELLQALTAPEEWTRSNAKRVLKERSLLGGQRAEVIAAIKDWSRNMDSTAPGYHQRRQEALWMYLGLGDFGPDAAELLEWQLKSHDYRARAAAVRVLGHWVGQEGLGQRAKGLEQENEIAASAVPTLSPQPSTLSLLARAVTDEHPRVRLEAVRILGTIQDPQAVVIAMRALDFTPPKVQNPGPYLVPDVPVFQGPGQVDEWLEYALWLTARELQPLWQPALSQGEIAFDDARHLAFALKSAGSPEAVPSLLSMLQAGKVAAADQRQVLDVISEFGRPEDLTSLLDMAAAQNADAAPLAKALVQTVLTADARRKIRPAGDLAVLAKLLTSEDAGVKGLAARAAGQWHVESLWGQVKELGSTAAKDNPQLKSDWLAAIAAYGGDEAIKLLDANVADTATFRSALIGLLPHNPKRVAIAFAERLQLATVTERGADADVNAVFAALLARKEGAELLTKVLDSQKISPDAAVIGQRAIAASGQPHEALAAALAKAANIVTGPRDLSPEQMAEMVALVQASGDPARGEAIYRRVDLNCQKCHAIGDAGGLVGPNMLSLGATAQVDYLVNSLLNPTKNVKEGYHTVVVQTDEGQTLSGVKLRESDADLVIRDAEDKEITIPVARIEQQKPGLSLMPSGLADKLTQAELADLIAFLGSLGKLPDYTINPSQLVIRRWQAINNTPQAIHAIQRTSYGTAASDHPDFQFTTAYTRVNGVLPLHDLPALASRYGLPANSKNVAFLRAELEVSQPGKCVISIEPKTGIDAWLNDKPLDVATGTVDLPVGKARLTIAAERDLSGDEIKVTLVPAEKDGAAVKPVGGK